MRMRASREDLPRFGNYRGLCEMFDEVNGAVYCVRHYESPKEREVYWHLCKRERSTGDRKDQTGWKIHVSVANTEENIAMAWQLVAAKVIEYGVYEAKAVGNRYVEKKHQIGKEIVIYEYSSRPDMNWQSFLQELENDFRRNGIVAGEHPNPKFRLPEGDERKIDEPVIGGSTYFYCETDEIRGQLREGKTPNYEDKGIFRDIVINSNTEGETL